MILSDNQKQAIHPQYSCWVEASAGTGKTKVLTDRVISLLLAGARIEEILCLTFTKAAGAEMAARIRARLLEWTTMGDENLTLSLEPFLGTPISEADKHQARRLFFQVLESPSGMRIQTIHGFCQFLLRSFPLEAGLLPHFQIIDDAQQKQFIDAALQKLWEKIPQKTADFLVRHMSEGQLEDFVHFALSHRNTLGDIDLSQKDLKAFLGVDEAEDPIAFFFKKMPAELCDAFTCPTRPTQQDQLLCDMLTALKEASLDEKVSLYGAYRNCFLTKSGAARKKIYSQEFEKKNPHLVLLFQEEVKRVLSLEAENALRKCWTRSCLFLDVAGAFLDLYATIKKEKSVIDYDDLIFYGARLLGKSDIKPWVFEKLDYHFQHVLVDEAQDTSQGQWRLLFHLIEEFFGEKEKTERTLFVVGDPKQSIYSFQGASPLGFQKAQTLFKNLGNARHVVLSESYRSAPQVLDVVNKVFGATNKMGVAGESHHAFRKTAKGSVTLWPLVAEEDSAPLSAWALPTEQSKQFLPRRALALQIADQIAAWISQKTLLHSRVRPIEPRDIMILVRRRDYFMDELVKALKARSIPVSGLDRLSLNDHIAIQDVLCLVDVLLLNGDDLGLATVLKSPFFGLSDEDLKTLCVGRTGTVWEALHSHPDYGPVCAVFDKLKALLEIAPSLENFFYSLLYQQDYRKKFIARLGLDVDDVFTALLDTVRQFEEQHGPHMALFISWVRGQNIQIKRSLEGGVENEVRLMTIHAAKGLQAPIVFLPDMTQTPTSTSSFHWKTGHTFFLWADRSVRQAAPKIQNFCATDEEIEEYYRLLYVALTRAEDHLYLCGWGTKKEVNMASWYKMLAPVMEAVGQEKDGKIVYGHPPEGTGKTATVFDKQISVSLPAWTCAPILPEAEQKITPSYVAGLPEGQDDAPNTSKARGILIHKILEHVVGGPHDRSLVRQYVEICDETPAEKENILKAVFAVLDHDLFSGPQKYTIKTEVSVQGQLNGFLVKGVIDLLMKDVTQKTIWILDYKTGRFDPSYKKHPPEQYVRQMNAYKKLLEKIHKSFTIKTGLVWTEIGWLQVL